MLVSGDRLASTIKHESTAEVVSEQVDLGTTTNDPLLKEKHGIRKTLAGTYLYQGKLFSTIEEAFKAVESMNGEVR